MVLYNNKDMFQLETEPSKHTRRDLRSIQSMAIVLVGPVYKKNEYHQHVLDLHLILPLNGVPGVRWSVLF